MRKIFVATLYGHNYGSALQTFALQKKLTELGAEVMVLQKPAEQTGAIASMAKKVINLLKPEAHYGVIKKLKRFLQKKKIAPRFAKIDKFTAKYVKFLPAEQLKERSVNTDSIFLAGSDQVWSAWTRTIDPHYLFSKLGQVKKYSYAASTGLSSFSEEKKAYYAQALADFQVLSFREAKVCDAMRTVFPEKEVRNDLDPTLLYDGAFWKEYCARRPVDEPYIFVYMIRPNDDLIRMARKEAQKTNCKIVYIGQYLNHYKDVISVDTPGVEEFLSYMYNAEKVITNSFHGTVFSVLFEKQFVSVYVESTSERAVNLLALTQLNDRLIHTIDELDVMDQRIDYATVRQKLDLARASSVEYLKRIVES